MKKQFYKWHKRLAILVGLPVLLWSLSGILHPMMSNWFKAEIAKKFLPPLTQNVVGLPQPSEGLTLPSSKWEQVSFLKTVNVANQPYYFAETPEKDFFLFDSKGQVSSINPYLEQRARAYADDQNRELKEVERIDEFNNLYSAVNRYLPVYRVSFYREDGLEVIIDPRTGKMARFDVPHIRVMKHLFGWLHTFSFLGSPDNLLRVLFTTGLSLLSIALGVTGVLNLINLKRKGTTGRIRKMSLGRRLHRLFGGVAYLFFMMFGLSGLLHVMMKVDYDHSPQMKHEVLHQIADLKTAPQDLLTEFSGEIVNANLAYIAGQSYWRILSAQGREQEVHYFHTATGQKLEEGEQLHLNELTTYFSEKVFGENLPVKSIDQVTSFSKAYGFIFRRLPVWKVQFNGGKALYIDTQDCALSKTSTVGKTIEGISFSMIHKFHFIDQWNKEARDWVSVIGSGLIFLTSVFGISLLIKRRKS